MNKGLRKAREAIVRNLRQARVLGRDLGQARGCWVKRKEENKLGGAAKHVKEARWAWGHI